VAYTFQSSIIENLGQLKFRIKALPRAAQISTVNAVYADDFDRDGNIDLILAGNFYPVNIQMGRYDASYGVLLKGNGKGGFAGVDAVHAGFSLKGETRAIRKIRLGNKDYYIAIRNNDTIEAFTLN
jgi:enediyne biosynthesis protein E4